MVINDPPLEEDIAFCIALVVFVLYFLLKVYQLQFQFRVNVARSGQWPAGQGVSPPILSHMLDHVIHYYRIIDLLQDKCTPSLCQFILIEAFVDLLRDYCWLIVHEWLLQFIPCVLLYRQHIGSDHRSVGGGRHHCMGGERFIQSVLLWNTDSRGIHVATIVRFGMMPGRSWWRIINRC